MAQFLIKVADEQGNLRQQVEHGYSEAEVHDRFVAQGYLVYWVKPRTLLTRGASGGRGKLRQSTFLIFNQQFLTLIKAGLPILTSLDLLIKRQRDKSLLQLLENVRERVKGGELLSDAFAAQQVFPAGDFGTASAGPGSGTERASRAGEVRGGADVGCAPPHQRRAGGALDSLHPTGTRAATAAEQAQTGVAGATTTQDFLSRSWTPANEFVVPTFDVAALISNGLRKVTPSNPRSRARTGRFPLVQHGTSS